MESSRPARSDGGDPVILTDNDGSDAGGLAVASAMECLALNMQVSLRVHTRAHFFGWTQGLLQSLFRHDVLICALCGGEPLSLRVDSFSLLVPDPGSFSETFLRDASIASSLIKAWEDHRFRPLQCDAAAGDVFACGAFSRALERVGATRLVVHGTHDADGQATSLFIFAGTPGGTAPQQADLMQLAVPFLHSAWVRTQVDSNAKAGDDPRSTASSNITAREREILKWIYLGKSNIEIGQILGISPLTVKNHVQKILRKLDVVNRAQAIGKALELRILRP